MSLFFLLALGRLICSPKYFNFKFLQNVTTDLREIWCNSQQLLVTTLHYTLTRRRSDHGGYFLKWRLEDSLDGHSWKTLKEHENDNGLKGNPYSHTWSVDWELDAFRYYKNFHTGKNSSGRFVRNSHWNFAVKVLVILKSARLRNTL